jgi:hypothetical protein
LANYIRKQQLILLLNLPIMFSEIWILSQGHWMIRKMELGLEGLIADNEKLFQTVSSFKSKDC